MIFKGHLTMLYPNGTFARFLCRQGVLLKDFKPYVERVSQQIKQHAEALATQAGRLFRCLETAMTAKNGHSKQELAKQLAEEAQISEGLVTVLYTLEPCSTFTVRGNRQTQRLEIVRRSTKCLHFYCYYLDRELGFIHIRLQSWFPFQIQVYVNGRECLARYLNPQGIIAYQRYANSFTHIADLPASQAFCEQFTHFEWPPVLNVLAERVNPVLNALRQAGFGSYYWVAGQCEIATDLLFKDRTSLEAILPDLFEQAILRCTCQDTLRFLGRKLHGNFKGQVSISLKKHIEGWRVKHGMKRNSIKMSDKASVLRVETTINNPSEFKICQQTDDGKLRWKPMGKGVSNLYRYAEVGSQANQRYLEHLAQAKLKSKALPHLDGLCRSHTQDGKRYARFDPLSQTDRELFQSVLAGENTLNGFRNRNLCARLYPLPTASSEEAKRRCTRVSRLIAKLRGHGLVALASCAVVVIDRTVENADAEPCEQRRDNGGKIPRPTAGFVQQQQRRVIVHEPQREDEGQQRLETMGEDAERIALADEHQLIKGTKQRPSVGEEDRDAVHGDGQRELDERPAGDEHEQHQPLAHAPLKAKPDIGRDKAGQADEGIHKGYKIHLAAVELREYPIGPQKIDIQCAIHDVPVEIGGHVPQEKSVERMTQFEQGEQEHDFPGRKAADFAEAAGDDGHRSQEGGVVEQRADNADDEVHSIHDLGLGRGPQQAHHHFEFSHVSLPGR